MSADAEEVDGHQFATWGDGPALELTPSTTELTPERVVDSLQRWHRLLDTDAVLEWRVIVEDGECRYSIAAVEETLDQLEPTLRQALPDYTLDRIDGQTPPELCEESLVGLRVEGHGARKNDWQTGLRPTVTDEEPPSSDASALTTAVDSLADTDATVVYQALITPKRRWGHIAEDRCRQLAANRDTRMMRFVDDYIVPVDAETDVEPDPAHRERIDLIRATDTKHSFDVAARALACGPDAETALEAFGSGLISASGPFYSLEPVVVRDPQSLVEEMTERVLPTRSPLSRVGRWAIGSGVRPTLTMDARTLSHVCLIEGATLTDPGRRMLGTTPQERTRLAHPDPDVLAQYDDGLTLGRLESPGDNGPAVVALPPSMQRMHALIVGKSGSGKSSLLVNGMLDNHAATDGLSILIDPKGDGLPREYMQAHYARYGTLDTVVHFDCSRVVPALSFFDVRPYLADGNARTTAIEDIVDHYIELLATMMGDDRFHQAIQSPSVIRYLVKALFDPVHGDDAFPHSALQRAVVQMKATQDAPPVSETDLERMLGGVTSNTTKTFEMVMGGAESRINKIPEDARLNQLFNHVPDGEDAHFDIYNLLDDDVVVVFDTSGLRSNARRAMTLVLLSNLWSALKRRAREGDEADRKLVNLYLEEAASVATSDIVTELLSQGRGFDLSMTLSMQFPEQLRAANRRAYAEVLNNVSTIVSGNVAVDDDLAKRFATDEVSAVDAGNRLRALTRGEWLVSLPSEFGTPEPRPFTLSSAPLPEGLPGSANPLTTAMQTAFDASARLVDDDTLEQYGIDTTVSRQTYENVEPSDGSSSTTHESVLDYSKRLPKGIEWESASNAFVCTHCDARYEPALDGLLRAVDCCYGLDRIDRDDVPLSSLTLKLSPEELAATGYSPQQLYFLQAVYHAHQQRFDTEWEYDMVSDSMVRLQEYTGIESDEVTQLVDEGLLSHDSDLPHRLYTVTADGRHVLNEGHKRGIAHGPGQGDLGESSLHVLMVELGRRYIEQSFVASPESAAVRAVSYHDVGGGSRLDAAGLNENGEVVVTFEAERTNHDILEAAPSDFDKMAEQNPEASIWLVENRDAAHKVIQALHDPKAGPPRIEKTYSESMQPQRFTIDTPGLTDIYTLRYFMNSILEDDSG